MSDTRTSLSTIAGCILGLLFGFVLFLGVPFLVLSCHGYTPESWTPFVIFVYGFTGFLIIGVPVGAAAGVSITRILLRRNTSLKRDMILVSILLLLLLGISFVVSWLIITEAEP